MFEIGSSLREARLRQAVDLPEAEAATKIRAKYLRALEDEHFELLPAQTYVKGFLRAYAEYLGLDGQLYVDEYNSRYVAGEEEPVLRPRRGTRQSPAHRRDRVERRALALVGIAAAAALVIVAWKWGGERRRVRCPASTGGRADDERHGQRRRRRDRPSRSGRAAGGRAARPASPSGAAPRPAIFSSTGRSEGASRRASRRNASGWTSRSRATSS